MATKFWSDPAAEPKRNYNYKVTLGTAGDAFWVKSCSTPSFDVSNTEIHHFDNRYYFPGRVTWNPVSIVMVDPINADVAKIVAEFLKNSDYQVPTNATTKTKSISRANSFAALGEVVIDVYGHDLSTGQAVETWTLKNAFIESAKFGDLAYDNDELKQIDMTIRYDHAHHSQSDLGKKA